MNLLIFSGSARQGNYTQHVAEFVRKTADKHPDFEPDVVSPDSLGLTFENEGTDASYPELKKKVETADAFIVISPEYNHGYSASTKYMLDLHLKEYLHKPIAMVGVSSGVFGGVRMMENLVGVLRDLGLMISFADVMFSNVQDEVENGEFTNPEKWQKRVTKQLNELSWLAQTLKYGRENIPSQDN